MEFIFLVWWGIAFTCLLVGGLYQLGRDPKRKTVMVHREYPLETLKEAVNRQGGHH